MKKKSKYQAIANTEELPLDTLASPEEQPADTQQKKFEQRYNTFMNGLSSTCEKENVQTAICIVIDPKTPDAALLFMKGREYEVAELLADALRAMKSKIDKRLTP